jgi:hypothetical protein
MQNRGNIKFKCDFLSVPGAPRIAFYHNFKAKEVILRKWNKEREDLDDYTSNELEVCLFNFLL